MNSPTRERTAFAGAGNVRIAAFQGTFAARVVDAVPVARPVTLPQLDALVDLVRGLFNDATGT